MIALLENKNKELIKKLDLEVFLSHFTSFLSREQNIFLAGDRNMHLRYIQELLEYDFIAPMVIKSCDNEILLLKKKATINIEAIVKFIQTLRYLKYLKKIGFKNSLLKLVSNINTPDEIKEVDKYLDNNFSLNDSMDEDLLNINTQIEQVISQIKRGLQQIVSKSSIKPYLVDTQIHMFQRQDSLLLRGGFNKILPSKIIGRSTSGFFYVVPYSVIDTKQKLSKLLDTQEEIIYKITKQISSIFTKHISFLEFSQRLFNRFDAYQARANFARSKNLEFITTSNNSKIKLEKFAHPAIENPTTINIDFNKTLLIITGVNAGGKTVLLKSILSAVFLAKHLLPMKIKAKQSMIGSYDNIIPIIEDPQNITAHISTFAGRMLKFSKLFGHKKNILIGVDEIELGTDSNEAASLFQAILKELMNKNNKIVVTTHHKSLASAMALDSNTQLLAAIYNEVEQKPTYRFLDGTIGKSFAFETALRYNIPHFIITKAREHYGKGQEELSGLIDKSTTLEYELNLKKQKLDKELVKIENIKQNLLDKQENLQSQYNEEKQKLQQKLQEAIQYAQKAIKEKTPTAHKLLNKAYTASINIKTSDINPKKSEKFTIGNIVKYNNVKGAIVEIKNDFATIESENLRLKVPIKELKISSYVKIKEKIKINITKNHKGKLSLDLHGVRVDDAIDRLDEFLSNCAMNDLKEVTIYHGMGTGRLAYVVKEFLDIHPCIIEYKDAPPNMGGYGATIAILSSGIND